MEFEREQLSKWSAGAMVMLLCGSSDVLVCVAVVVIQKWIPSGSTREDDCGWESEVNRLARAEVEKGRT